MVIQLVLTVFPRWNAIIQALLSQLLFEYRRNSLTSLVLTITETLRYRGAIGQWSWVLHRISGLGVVLFLTLHVVDTSWAVFYPALYVEAIAIYQTPLFTIGEFALVACVVYHALNGIRIAIFDYRPELWKLQAKAAVVVLIATVLILIPVFILMFAHVLDFYSGSPQTLGLIEVITAQLPFAVGIGAALIAAVLLSLITQPILGRQSSAKPRGSRIERFWWSFMRVSGVLILPLVFGHLAMMHVIQGVFDITVAGHSIVGTDFINAGGTSVEFVANRWGYLVAGVAIWRVYDFALLALVVTHGFNGLRYVLTDYTTFSPILRRAAIYFCTIGAVVLLALGGAALLSTVDSTTIQMAEEAAATLHGDAPEGESPVGLPAEVPAETADAPAETPETSGE
jgi:succinate dehydrogenase / fumarate reductase cytochrome b subunit